MKLIFKLFKEIFSKFPFIFIILFSFIFIQAFLNSSTIIAMAPLVDYLMEVDENKTSFITNIFKNFFQYSNPGSILKLTHIMFFIGSVFLFSGIAGVLTQYMILVVQYRLLNFLLSDTLNYFLNAKYSFFNEVDIGKIVNSFQNEVGKVAQAFAGMTRVAANFVQGIVLLSVPLSLSTNLTLYFMGITLVLIAPMYFAKKLSYKFGKLSTLTSSRMTSHLHETLTSVKLIQSFGLQKKTIDSFKIFIKEHSDWTIKFQTLNRGLYLILIPLGTISALLTLFIAFDLGMQLAEMAMVFFAFSRLLPIIAVFIQERSTIEGFLPAYEQIIQFRNHAKKLQESKHGKKFNILKKGIEFKNLSFTFFGRNKTLKKLNLFIEKGKTTSFVGKSGSGKTTIIDLLLGLYPVNENKIFIDDISIDKFNINSFRKNIGYVPQEPQLFNMSIRNNILWANPNLTDEEILNICKKSNSHQFITDFPEGLDTMLGDRGIKMSGGQRQRLALARAIAKKPSVLILDEATSNLDSESEYLIQNSINKLSKEMTIITIAHRLSTIKSSDFIYVIDQGMVIDKGSFEELSTKKRGAFFELISKQII